MQKLESLITRRLTSWPSRGALAPVRSRPGSHSIGLRRQYERRRSLPASHLTEAVLCDSGIPSCVPRAPVKRIYDFLSSCTFFVCTILTDIIDMLFLQPYIRLEIEHVG